MGGRSRKGPSGRRTTVDVVFECLVKEPATLAEMVERVKSVGWDYSTKNRVYCAFLDLLREGDIVREPNANGAYVYRIRGDVEWRRWVRLAEPPD